MQGDKHIMESYLAQMATD
jgi:hypothetical protein